MIRLNKVIPVVAGLLVLPSTRILAIDSTLASKNVVTKSVVGFETIETEKLQKMFLINDTAILSSTEPMASTIDQQPVGSQVSILEVDGNMCKVLTSSNVTGYVNMDLLTSQAEYVFTKDDVVMYADEDGTELKALPFEESETVVTVDQNTELTVTGKNDLTYWRISYDNNVYYVNQEDLMSTKYVKPVVTTVSFDTSSIAWDGSSLNPVSGSIYGPSGKETYYNLPMGGVISIMRGIGNTDEYWVRADGVKMLGDYVMVACDLSIRPRGSLVATSLGTGIVCDTGTFIYSNPTQVDIAVAW